jgi:hypothetical protein
VKDFVLSNMHISVANTNGADLVKATLIFDADLNGIRKLDHLRAKITDIVLQTIGSKTMEELSAPDARTKLRTDIMAAIRPLLDDNDGVKNVYFQEFVVLPASQLDSSKSHPDTFSKNYFSILGQVEKPGMYNFPEYHDSLRILEALAMAGGTTKLSDLGAVQIQRQSNGKVDVSKVNLREIISGKGDFTLLPGDIIIIGERAL